MESIGRSIMGSNTNTTIVSTACATSAVVGLLISPARPTVATITSNTKTTGLSHNVSHRVPLQHCSNHSNVIQQHHYPSILVAPPTLVPSSLIHSTQTSPLLVTSPQLMLSTTSATASGVIPQFQQHNGGSHQLITATTVPVSATSIVMPTSNITTVGMALSPFGILPHERVVPHTHHRHQHKKLSSCPPCPSKIIMDTGNTNNVVNSQRFYIEPTHVGNKMKQYDTIQQQPHKIKIINGFSDKNLPVVPSAYVPQSYEQRYQPRTTSQQVGYLSVITRTAVTTNGVMMNDTIANNSYYQAHAIPLQSKTSNSHDRQYYHFDSTVPASQTPQQLDNILLMGSPVQRGDPMHIVKNLQSMQTDVDCYGVKKVMEQQPRLLHSEINKTVGPILSNNGSKCIIENQHQHLQQVPKSTVIDPSTSYNEQYFNKRQPPPAHLHQHHNQSHLQQHIITGNTKIFPTPTSLTVLSANGNTYLDVQQHQRHHRWNPDQQKLPVKSTSSCVSGNSSATVFHQSSLQQPHQQYNNTTSTFNIQPPASSINQNLQLSQPAHNNFIVSSVNPTYYNLTTSHVSSTITSVTTSSLLYNRQQNNSQSQQHTNDFHDYTNLQGGNYIVNNDNKSSPLPHVIVPNIEQELSHLCNDLILPVSNVKRFNIISQQPSFIDSYIKFINGGTDATTKMEDEYHEKPKKLLLPLFSSTPKPISRPYTPLQNSKPVATSELSTFYSGSVDDIKKIGNVTTTTYDDPRYFPLPKTSSLLADISEEKSDDSFGEHSWLSVGDDGDQWWKSTKASSSTTTVIQNKEDIVNKKKKNNTTTKKKRSNSGTAIKKQKTKHVQQPRRQLSHRLAKEKTQKLLRNMNGDLDDDELLSSDTDSDVDPAWIPSGDNIDTSKNSSSIPSRRQFNHKKYSNTGHSSTNNNNYKNNKDHLDDTTPLPFKSGSFVALKDQLQDNEQITSPQQLWRVDGKSLLQKFERCNENNCYKSVSTYTGWSPIHYSLYRQVTVKFITTPNCMNTSNKSSTAEIVVQLICDDENNSTQNNSVGNNDDSNQILKPKVDDFNCVSSINSDVSIDEQSVSLRANFDVYIQTLISQALDSNFLDEIYHENDGFFLSNIRAIETVTQNLLQTLNSSIMKNSESNLFQKENILTMISMYPNIQAGSTDEISPSVQLRCFVCGYQGLIKKQQKFTEISLSGNEYNSHTLKNIDNNKTLSKIMPKKKIYCCSSNAQCADKVMILHNLEHLKYYIYKECCERITTENDNICNELTQDTTTVLNRMLADDVWIEKLFQMVRNTWSRAKNFVSNMESSN